jgi:hypothetical protein
MRSFRLRRFGALFLPASIVRVPKVDDAVWWAPKQVGCRITKLEWDGSLMFQGGDLIKKPSGKVMPEWSVATMPDSLEWDPINGWWICGQGATPRKGTVLFPDPMTVKVGANG